MKERKTSFDFTILHFIFLFRSLSLRVATADPPSLHPWTSSKVFLFSAPHSTSKPSQPCHLVTPNKIIISSVTSNSVPSSPHHASQQVSIPSCKPSLSLLLVPQITPWHPALLLCTACYFGCLTQAFKLIIITISASCILSVTLFSLSFTHMYSVLLLLIFISLLTSV